MIEITGLEEMRAKLRLLDQKVRTQYVVNAVKAGSQIIADAMKEDAPIREPQLTGDALPIGAMRRAIKVRERLDKDGFAVATIGPGKLGYVARWVEYGHRLVHGGRSKMTGAGATGPGKETGQVEPHPFLRPAFERSESEAIDKFKSTMRDQIAGGLK